jgi:iron-sulfur cluster assembly accessory protein
MTPNIQVTDNVFKRILELRQKSNNPHLHLRVSVNGGGCSGFVYDYAMVEETKPDDLVISQEDIKVLIDPASQEFIAESIVDFIEELGSAYFSIRNPNASAKCGCGNSFAI